MKRNLVAKSFAYMKIKESRLGKSSIEWDNQMVYRFISFLQES